MSQEQRYQQAMNRGHTAAWDREWDRAVAFYRQALEEKPDDPKALSNLALAFLNLQEFEKSLRHYLRAAEVAPNDPLPLEKAATLYVHMGQAEKASKLSDRAAELYLKERNADKAIENWSRAIALDFENLQAHTRLAVVYERLGRKPQAVREYLHMASLFQHAGQNEKAFDAVNRALQVDRGNKEARQAQTMLRGGKMLPKPAIPRGGTGPFEEIKLSKPLQLSAPKEPAESNLNPIEEAQKEALAALARLFFDQSSEAETRTTSRRGLQAIMDGTGSPAFTKDADCAKIMLHLGLVVELQSQDKTDQAAEELKGAINAGLDSPAAYFYLGAILAGTDRLESAVRNLQRVLPHADFALGSRLLLGGIWYQQGKYSQAAERYLEALRSADAQVVSPQYADELRELYEPLIDALSREKNQDRQKQLCENIAELLVRPNWRTHLRNARQQLGDQENDSSPIPLAEVLIESSSSDVVVAMSTVRSLARAGHLGAALEEILFALHRAPTYLPLHIVLGDLLVSKDRLMEASEKFSVIARAYSARGESRRAIHMLKRVVEMVPMDWVPRRQLIDHLVSFGQVDEAIGEYLKLAEVHYSMAELEKARDVYTQALGLAPQSENPANWQVRILHRIADIETQSLSWRKAIELYKQISVLRPDDREALRSIVSLFFNLGEPEQALTALDQFIIFMSEGGNYDIVIQLLEQLVSEQPGQAMINYRLAVQYEQTGNISGAVKSYDAAGELLLEAGDKTGGFEMIRRIIQLDPPEKEKYQKLLNSL
ncbi:MAG: tetratricopeptide repeat protein [Chloroflexota bacterium]